MSACPVCPGLQAPEKEASFIAALSQSVLRLGEHQAYPGYAVLWSRSHARELHHLDPAAYSAFMQDLRRASAAVEKASGCAKLNTVILGNQVEHLHVHLFPRSAMDPQRREQPWVHADLFKEPGTPQQRQAAIARIREALEQGQ